MASSHPRKGAPACAGLVRELYGQGVPLAEIRRRTGLTPAALYWWLDRKVVEDGSVVFDPLPRRHPPRLSTKGRTGAPRARLLARLWSTAEQQVAQIEARMADASGPGEGMRTADAEKDARALALIARTLRELSAVEDAARKTRKGKAAVSAGSEPEGGGGEGQGHGAGVRDRDAFRRELARRLDRLRAERQGAEPSE